MQSLKLSTGNPIVSYLVSIWRFPSSPVLPRQVSAPPKRRPPKDEPSQPLEPETWTQKAAACLALVLKDSADSRTASLKLAGLEYASELANKLLKHAEKMETFYPRLKSCVDRNAGEKACKAIVEEYEALADFGAKAQAWFETNIAHVGTCIHYTSFSISASLPNSMLNRMMKNQRPDFNCRSTKPPYDFNEAFFWDLHRCLLCNEDINLFGRDYRDTIPAAGCCCCISETEEGSQGKNKK